MQIIPVVYILGGQTVALYKGTIDQKKVYRKSPLKFAQEFQNDGAKELYIVDLDASEYGSDKNVELITDIRANLSVSLICAGGIRTMAKLKEVIDVGINRVVLGVAAEQIFKQAIEQYGDEKIIIGIKAKGDEVITEVERRFPLRVIDFAEKLPSYGAKYVLFKDMFKESTQIGPNYDEIDRILRMTPLKVYASGGISSEKHLKILKDIGSEGAVIGKALYEGGIYLRDIIDKY